MIIEQIHSIESISSKLSDEEFWWNFWLNYAELETKMNSKYHKLSNVDSIYQRMSFTQKIKSTIWSSAISTHESLIKQNHLILLQKNRRSLFSWYLFFQLINFLWLTLIATLLILNYTNHVVDVSAWCLLKRCSANLYTYTDNFMKKVKQLHKENHNTLRALQFVIKILKAWFMLILISLMYDLSMIFQDVLRYFHFKIISRYFHISRSFQDENRVKISMKKNSENIFVTSYWRDSNLLHCIFLSLY